MEKYWNEIKAFIYGSFIYLQIDKEIATILIILIFSDMFVGTIKSVSIPTMDFSMEKFWKGLLKKVLLLIIIMVLALVSKGLGFEDFKTMVTVVMKIMLLNEGLSIINGVRSIYDRKEHKNNDFISLLIAKIENYLTFYLDKILSFFDNNTKCL